MVQNFMVQGRLFRGSQENSPEGTPLPSRGGVYSSGVGIKCHSSRLSGGPIQCELGPLPWWGIECHSLTANGSLDWSPSQKLESWKIPS